MQIIKHNILRLTSFSFIFLLNTINSTFSVLIQEDSSSENSTVAPSASIKKNVFNNVKQELEIHDWEKIHSVISEIENIKSVFIRTPHPDDQELLLLNKLPAFQHLRFSPFGGVNDQTIKIIPSILPSLTEFHAPLNQIGEEGLIALSHSAKKLEVLDLTSNSGVDDQGISHIIALQSLKKLYLSNTNITSESIKYLKLLKNLEELHVVGTSINQEDLADLKNARPKLQQHGAIQANRFL